MSTTPRKYNVSSDDPNMDINAYIDFMARLCKVANKAKFADEQEWQPDYRRVRAAALKLKGRKP